MADPRAPGVYIQEVTSGDRPISAVGTTTAGFVGRAPDAKAHVNAPVAVNSFGQFLALFGGGGAARTDLAHAVQGFFLNGGSRCYVVNIGGDGPVDGPGIGLDRLAAIDEVAMIAAPGRTDLRSYEALIRAAETLKDRVAILDAPATVADVADLTRVMTEPPPPAEGKPPPPAEGKQPPPAEGKPAEPKPQAALRPPLSDSGHAACYFPWLRVADPADPGDPRKAISVPPSGHMAGIWARTDNARGVHKAPANEPIAGVLGLTQLVTRREQGLLNEAGVNCIRVFPTEGIRVWGARTLAPGASQWKYLNVRRLFNMVEESIARSTSWVVFEPNDAPLWKQIRRDVSAFLTLLWRQGALMGATPDQAFFVKCDAETNPPEAIRAGEVRAVIGLAPVRPAEFVVFEIGQSAAGASIVPA
jgi:phage tail sheath protein FI